MARILLVEDDPALRRGLVATLRAAGYAVDTAGDGASGFEIARKEPYALIILDVGLTDLSGFEVLKRLRQRGIKTPILILTARDTVQDRVTGLDLHHQARAHLRRRNGPRVQRRAIPARDGAGNAPGRLGRQRGWQGHAGRTRQAGVLRHSNRRKDLPGLHAGHDVARRP